MWSHIDELTSIRVLEVILLLVCIVNGDYLWRCTEFHASIARQVHFEVRDVDLFWVIIL